MSRYCLDTSAYAWFRRGSARIVELLDTAAWIGVPSIVIGELWLGFLGGARWERNARELQEFLGHSLVHEIPVDSAVARIYADIVLALRKAGTPIPTNDIWIAAAAASVGAAVVTFDEHFRAVGRVGSILLQEE